MTDLPNLPANIEHRLPNARMPLNYEAAKNAVAKCARIDECKEWADKSAAIASYAKQIKDKELRESANRIVLRAKIRIGELLDAIPPAAPIHHKRGEGSGCKKNPNSRMAIAKSHNIGSAQASRYIGMSRVSPELRDELIDASPPVGVSSLAAMGQGTGPKRGFHASEIYNLLMRREGYGQIGLTAFTLWISKLPPKKYAHRLRPDEALRVREAFTDILEWIDEFDQRMPPSSKGDKRK